MNQKRALRQLNRLLKKVRECCVDTEKLSDDELARKTSEFKERLSGGESLDSLLPEAFAVIAEADRRVLGKYPYDSQIRGAIALHKGFLAEMNTGEGKTLVATLPLYLNALTGKSTILVTTNEYLALRDAEEMGQVFNFLGLSCTAGVKEHAEERFSNAEKKEIYAHDIVYTTHSILGFDYLLNNLVTKAKDRFMRELYYCIIDEADSVLLDAATTPLVISGSPRVQSNLYELADFFVTTLEKEVDYDSQDKKTWLTKEGVKKAEMFFYIDNFYDEKYFEINRHVNFALRAHTLFEKEKEYVVSSKDEIVLIDSASGRMMPGVKLRGGQHQALEAKEHLKLTSENRSVASITYQNLFMLFEKISGMSGTINDASREIFEVYGLNVLAIPPHAPVQRIDYPDSYYTNETSQFYDALEEALTIHETGQPVLIVVSTIGQTELVSEMLTGENIPHSVLNANNAFWEADIIKEAGQLNAVTVATSMAGRGTDIKLGPGVKELGGLAVIGIGRMINVRQERQARGRAGRQGDPGLSKFFVCLEDDIVKDNGKITIERYISGKKKISERKLGRVINNAQHTAEETAVTSRKNSTDYDKVLQTQRRLIYATRDKLLDGGIISKEQIVEIARKNINEYVDNEARLTMEGINRYILDNISYHVDDGLRDINLKRRGLVKKYLIKRVEDAYDEQYAIIKDDAGMGDFARVATLTAIDEAWVEQVDYLQQLQAAVSGRAAAQRNLLFEYQKDAYESFEKMEKTVLKNVVRNILLSNIYLDEKYELRMILP